MILTNRLFEREIPNREAKSIYIFSEGVKREVQYFNYFKGLDSRINIEVYKLDSNEDNSPLGLLSIAKKCIIKTELNPNPKYDFLDGDEVWIVLDIDKDKGDSRAPQLELVKEKCDTYKDWFLTRSNPCFEVWLYYHKHENIATLQNPDICANWKQLVNSSIHGGFDSRRHPIYIENACNNAKQNFNETESTIEVGNTEVYKLAQSIIPLIKSKLNIALGEIQ